MADKPVAVVVLTWNGLSITRRCLESLRTNTDHDNYQVVVADNGSTDGTLEYLRSLSWIKLVENNANLGFSKGNNRAIKRVAKSADVVLMNNDVVVGQRDWLRRLQQTAYSGDDVGVVGCRLRNSRGVLLHTGAYMSANYHGVQEGGQERDVNQYNEDREVEIVVFACAYLKRSTINKIGLLDEDYFCYFEDSDYCFKARQHGLKTVCCGSVTLIHDENSSTAVNGVSVHPLLAKGRDIFMKKWKRQLDARRYHLKIGWNSFMNAPMGYTVSSRCLACALDRLGVEVGYRYCFGPGTPVEVAEPPVMPDGDVERVKLIQSRPVDPSTMQVAYSVAEAFPTTKGAHRVGFTMLEVDGIPKEWVRLCNAMDEMWVPSSFNVETFGGSGVTRPMHVIPLGIDPHYFNPGVVGHRHPTTCTFLSVFEWGERKAPEILLRAFRDEFDQHEDVVLVCKLMNNDESVNIPAQVHELGLRPGGGRIVFSINDMVPLYQLGSLYRSFDCFVSCTRGEGWGMPILEAMACGLPVIATDWSAQRDFYDRTVGFPIDVHKLIPAKAKCPLYKGFRWAEPSYEHLRHQLRYVYDHPEEARAVGLRAARHAHQHFTWEHAAQKIIGRIEDVGLPASTGRREVA